MFDHKTIQQEHELETARQPIRFYKEHQENAPAYPVVLPVKDRNRFCTLGELLAYKCQLFRLDTQ